MMYVGRNFGNDTNNFMNFEAYRLNMSGSGQI